MISVNRVILAGNLTRDPVLRTVSSGLAVAQLGLAVNESFKLKNGEKGESTCFVDIVVWDKQAQACADYLAKGDPVLIEGKLQFDSWENPEGQRQNKLKVKADRVQFLRISSRKSSQTEVLQAT